MTEDEANTLTKGAEVYNGAHRGVVVSVARDECTIRWDPLKMSKGCWNTTSVKPSQIVHMTLGSKRAFEPSVGGRKEEQFTKLLKDTLRELGASPKKINALLVAHSAAIAASTHQGRVSGIQTREW